MAITLKPSTEALLLEKARQEGQDLDTLVDKILAESLEAQKRENEEVTAAIRNAMAAAEAGREKPLAQYLAEQRVKHGYSDGWPQRGVATEVSPGVFVENEWNNED